MSDNLNKVDQILHRTNQYYQAVALGITPPNKTDFAQAKKQLTTLLNNEKIAELESLELNRLAVQKGIVPLNVYNNYIQKRIATLKKGSE